MTGTLRVPRSRGAASGFLLAVLGAWGALIPFVGPYFHYAYTPASAWMYTSGRLWLSVVPGAAALVGGLILLVASFRPAAMLGAGLAALGGAWLLVGTLLSSIWPAIPSPGAPAGGPLMRAVEQLGFFTGLGALIVFVAAFAFGRLSVVGVRDARTTVPATAADSPVGEAAGTGARGAGGPFHRTAG